VQSYWDFKDYSSINTKIVASKEEPMVKMSTMSLWNSWLSSFNLINKCTIRCNIIDTRLFKYTDMTKLKLYMNQILQQACKTRCIPKPIGEIIISLLMKFQDDQRCVIKCQFHESFWILHYVVMFNPLITQIKSKNWFVPFHVLSRQVFSIVTFCLVTFLQS